MPAARGVKRTASKTSAVTTSAAPKNKKKRGAIQLEVPSAPKKRGRVLVCGQGDVGQLGLGEDVSETTKFQNVPALGGKVVDVCAGGMHTVALDSNGKVWTFGCNDEGALGRVTNGDTDEATPKAVKLPGAVCVSAGDSHSAALLRGGDVYVWGAFRDSHGSMGLVIRGREGKACKEPIKVEIDEPAVDIASGGDHLVILTTSGSIYTMGCGEQGQLGRLSQRSASREARQGFSALLTPSKVTLKAGASRIWAGYHATFALDATGTKMFAWGLNNYGQLGITGENRKTAIYAPKECSAFSTDVSWRKVACGQHHSLALADSGDVYAIGRCEYGRLGLGEQPGDAESLVPIPKLQGKKCIDIAAGTSNSFAVTDSGEVFAWGMGSEGQLGTGSRNDALVPSPAVLTGATSNSAVRIAAGGQHTVLLLEDTTSTAEESAESEEETAEQKVDEEMAEPEETQEPEKKKARATKRQNKQDQEDEVSSTSSAPVKPQKVNGDEKQETAMEVDETDSAKDSESKETTKEEQTPTPEKTEEKVEPPPTKETEPVPEVTTKDKPETTDTSSQETTDSETKSQEAESERTAPETNPLTLNDVDMEKAELNGDAAEKALEIAPTPLTTTA